jgi:hypothetical protein
MKPFVVAQFIERYSQTFDKSNYYKLNWYKSRYLIFSIIEIIVESAVSILLSFLTINKILTPIYYLDKMV